MIQAASITQDRKKKKLILLLKRAEELWQCYAMVRSLTKPKQSGSLSHIKVPTITATGEPGWESIYKPSEIKTKVLQQHCTHFSQADSSIFTVKPLRFLVLNNDCTSPYTQQILAGTADIDSVLIDNYTKSQLHHLKSKTLPNKKMAHPMDQETMIQGFKKWPEATTTSLSRRHLAYTNPWPSISCPYQRTKTTQPQTPNQTTLYKAELTY